MGVLLNFHKSRVRVSKCFRTSRSSGYCDTGVQNSQKFRAGTKAAVPVPRVLWRRSTELTELPATGMNVLQNSQKFQVRV